MKQSKWPSAAGLLKAYDINQRIEVLYTAKDQSTLPEWQ